MESPHLYENIDTYKKDAMKLKSYNDVPDDYINSDLANNEVSLNLHTLIDEPNSIMSESLISDLQGLNVDKNSLSAANCPRGLGANPSMACLPQSLSASNMYNTLPYVPQAVHGGSQFDRQYGSDRLPIKEEPYDNSPDAAHEYASCARMNYSGYGYPLTSPVVPSSDSLKSPLKNHSPMVKPGQKTMPKIHPRTDDEYRKRRERNNIAVRKSREKAKARTRETEEKVKQLSDENRHLRERCKTMGEELSLFKHFFQTMNVDGVPEPIQTELRNMVEKITHVENLSRPNLQLLEDLRKGCNRINDLI